MKGSIVKAHRGTVGAPRRSVESSTPTTAALHASTIASTSAPNAAACSIPLQTENAEGNAGPTAPQATAVKRCTNRIESEARMRSTTRLNSQPQASQSTIIKDATAHRSDPRMQTEFAAGIVPAGPRTPMVAQAFTRLLRFHPNRALGTQLASCPTNGVAIGLDGPRHNAKQPLSPSCTT